MKHTIARILIAGGAAGSVLFAGVASAIDWNITGFVRQEIGYSLSGGENPNNQSGNPFNNRVTPHITHAGFGAGAAGAVVDPVSGFALGSNAAAPTSLYTDPDGVTAFGGTGGMFSAGFAGAGFLPAGTNTANAVDCQYNYNRAVAAGAAGGAGGFGPRVLSDGLSTFANNGFAGCPGGGATGEFLPGSFAPGDDSPNVDDNQNINLFNSRLEVDVQAKINKEFSAYMKFRAYYDATSQFHDGKTGDHYGNQIWGSRGTLTELNSNSAVIDIPALYLDWNRGPLWVRLGNQTIAWGEAYFFRTTDVANGLDLRRHLTLGPGAEEYQDQRIASPGIRVSYTFNNGWEIDAFAQMFSPTILPGQNTPYNLVPTAGARLDDDEGFDDAEGAINFGARLTMPLTEALTAGIAYVNRRNPDGVFVNVDAPTFHAGQVNSGCLNQHNDTLNVLANGVGGLFFGGVDPGFGSGTIPGVQSALANTGFDVFPTLNRDARHSTNGCGSAFAPDPLGSPSIKYWQAIQDARLDNADYLQHVINDFPAAEWAVRDIFGFGNEENFADTYRTLEGFRSSFGPFIQWVGRQFKRESIFMVNANYIITMDDPNSLFDQMIVRGEVAVTPNKKMTTNLHYDFKEVDDIVSALILEKYHRISEKFPATYIVMQWMHRTSTDLFGRDLDNNNTANIGTFIDSETGNFTAAAFSAEAMKPKGSSNANYVVFAFQQPFPNLIWRFDFAILVDVAGGYLVQPGLRYRPAANWQWDLYATIIESPGGNRDTITESIDFADEVFMRLTYYF